MEKQEFFELAKNRNKYKVLKKLDGELAYAEIGNTYFSDTLFERGYNIIELCKTGYLELVPRVFDFEKDIVGKNIHSVLSVCPECGSHGVNMPLEKQCGNCGYTECWTYYDAETIDNLLPKTVATEDKKAPVLAEEILNKYRSNDNNLCIAGKYTLEDSAIINAMQEYASQERNRAIQEFEKIIEKIKHGLKQMVDEAPNMRSPDGRFGQREEDRNHGMEQAAKLALVMVKLIEEKELSKLKK